MAGQGAARSPPARTPSSVVLKQSAPRLSGLKLDPVPRSACRAGLSDTACLCSTRHHLQRPRGRGTEPLEASFAPAPDGSRWRGAGTSPGTGIPNLRPLRVPRPSSQRGGRVLRMRVPGESQAEVLLPCGALPLGVTQPSSTFCLLRRSQKAVHVHREDWIPSFVGNEQGQRIG